MKIKSIKDIDFSGLRKQKFFPSPSNWADQVLYFLMLDRFSDANENDYLDNDGKPVKTGKTPKYKPADFENAIQNESDAEKWRNAGSVWIGKGTTIKGLTSKIGYLKRLGITAIWVSPVFKQVSFQNTYHGYGIQNYLEVDSHFGTSEELKAMIKTAHKHGMYIILDIIINHSGNVFSYNLDPNRYPAYDEETKQHYIDPRWDSNIYSVKGFNNASGDAKIPFIPGNKIKNADDAVWPVEFQEPAYYTCKGHICNWNYFPEYLEGDFCDLKDIHLGTGNTDNYVPSAALKSICDIYKFWIAYLDIDGFRCDTVKHVDKGAARYFNSAIHEFAEYIGKENFYMIAEITGGREFAYDTLEETGMNAALGIDDVQVKMAQLIKGNANPNDYFGFFRNSILLQKDSHVWFRDKIVTQLDDHDKVCMGKYKARFCGSNNGSERDRSKKLVLAALALNAMTLGIPCIYYGTEQCFDGEGDSDKYIRESMFGGEFGAFRTQGRHFFDENSYVYMELSQILKIRSESLILRRGRQYLREISSDGNSFGYPQILGGPMLSIVPWSRIMDTTEMLCAINTDPDKTLSAFVIVDNDLNNIGNKFSYIYSTDKKQINEDISVQRMPSGAAAVRLTVPGAGFVVLGKK